MLAEGNFSDFYSSLFFQLVIYIGINAFDSKPKKIVGRLTRRDWGSESDWLSIEIDSYHDHQTGQKFSINPAGVKTDTYLYDDYKSDQKWDAVWEGRTNIDNSGWTAEYKIPFSALRFPKSKKYVFGFNVMRNIVRNQETDQWVMIPRKESGWVSRFGNLLGN